MYKKLIYSSFFLFFLFSCKNSYGFLINEIAGTVNGTPVTLNELYFSAGVNQINELKCNELNYKFSKSSLKRNLNIYINRLIILEQEKKIGMIKVSKNRIDAYIKSFKKKFKAVCKNMQFQVFLKKYGFNTMMFFDYVKNILLEKEFIYERLHFLSYSPENGITSLNNAKKIQSKELLSKLKAWIQGLRKHADIEINGNY